RPTWLHWKLAAAIRASAHPVTSGEAELAASGTPGQDAGCPLRDRHMRHRCWLPLLLACLCVLAAACRPAAEAPAAPAAWAPGAARPAQAVRLLTRHLRDDALDAYARDAGPPDLHARLETAWHEGRTRWPLDELPLGEHLPGMLAALEKPDAEARWR